MRVNMPHKLSIDIWSDVMCPWCLIGYGQLQQGLDIVAGEIEAEIRWRPFELNPDMPREGEEQSQHIARKYGRSASETQAVRGRMRQAAEQAGVSLDYTGGPKARIPDPDGLDGERGDPPAMMWNSFDAHCLLEWTLQNHGAAAQTTLKVALLTAHFNQRRDIGARPVLLEIAQSVGLDMEQASACFDNEQLAQEVRREEQFAMDMNITGVPAVVIEGKFMVPGAQSAQVFADVLRRVVARSKAAEEKAAIE